jgi:transcription initiation factor TFIIIB Brf1 subunit/transcription initiation factor TFIIB
MTASGAVPLIKVENKRAIKIEPPGNILYVKKVRIVTFNIKKTPVSFKACIDKFVNSLNLNLELESKIISTKANTLMEVKKASGKDNIGAPL